MKECKWFLLLLLFTLLTTPLSCGSDDSSESEDEEPDIECSYDVDCGVGYVCMSGKCFKTCVTVADCGTGQLCQNNICRADPNYVASDGDIQDGDATNGDTTDGDLTDGDTSDGDLPPHCPDGFFWDPAEQTCKPQQPDVDCNDGQTWCFAKELHFCDVGQWEPIDCKVICRQDGQVFSDCGPVDVGGRTIPYCICTEPADGDVSDGDVTDGDSTDGDVTDGDGNDCDMLCTGRCGMFFDCYCGECGSGQICNDANFCETDCEAICNGRCGGFSGCDCGQCPEGEYCDRTNVCLPDHECIVDSQCGEETCDPWSRCDYDSLCDTETGKMRTCFTPKCIDNACTTQPHQENGTCTRSTDGLECADPVCGSYGACECRGECGLDGDKIRECVEQRCNNGHCANADSFDSNLSCSCDPTGDICSVTYLGYDDMGLCTSSGDCVWNDAIWRDSTTGLTWTVYLRPNSVSHSEALSDCNSLGGGFRLPSISELRSIVAGCSKTSASGGCPITDECNNSNWDSGCFNYDCFGCLGSSGQGPDDGCYRKTSLEGRCSTLWSSTENANTPGEYFYLSFDDASVMSGPQNNDHYLRCVKGP